MLPDSNIHYLKKLDFESPKVLITLRRQTLKAVKWGCLSREAAWLGALFQKQLFEGTVADISIKWVDHQIGHGVFTNQDLGIGDYVGEYTGVVRKRRLFSSRGLNDYSFSYPTSSLFFKKFTIDAETHGNEMRYINHSDSPNCEAVSVLCNDFIRVVIRATKAIPRGSQLHYDYGPEYWSIRRKLPV
jgi:hypothetical protein